jgi:hypothetical protein
MTNICHPSLLRYQGSFNSTPDIVRRIGDQFVAVAYLEMDNPDDAFELDRCIQTSLANQPIPNDERCAPSRPS